MEIDMDVKDGSCGSGEKFFACAFLLAVSLLAKAAKSGLRRKTKALHTLKMDLLDLFF